jgi:flagellar FliL protein
MSEAAAAPAEKKPARSKKGLIIIIAVAVVVLGGGAGAWFAFMGHPAAGSEAAAAEAGKEEDKKEGKEESEPRLPAEYVEMSPPFVVNFEPGAAARFLQIAVQVKTRSHEMVELLKHNTPLIRNDLLVLFGNKHVEEVATPEGKEALREAALEAVRHIVKEEGGEPEEVEAVLFTSFVMQ